MKFEHLLWQNDRMVLDDLVFRLQHYISDDWDSVLCPFEDRDDLLNP